MEGTGIRLIASYIDVICLPGSNAEFNITACVGRTTYVIIIAVDTNQTGAGSAENAYFRIESGAAVAGGGCHQSGLAGCVAIPKAGCGIECSAAFGYLLRAAAGCPRYRLTTGDGGGGGASGV